MLPPLSFYKLILSFKNSVASRQIMSLFCLKLPMVLPIFPQNKSVKVLINLTKPFSLQLIISLASPTLSLPYSLTATLALWSQGLCT